jgi:hypothetical protein
MHGRIEGRIEARRDGSSDASRQVLEGGTKRLPCLDTDQEREDKAGMEQAKADLAAAVHARRIIDEYTGEYYTGYRPRMNGYLRQSRQMCHAPRGQAPCIVVFRHTHTN